MLRDALGKPREGVHSIRLFDIAVVDVVLTIIAAFLISRWTRWSFLLTLAGFFLLGIAVHRALRVNTKINVAIFGQLD
jgi:fatty acid desaturase